MTTKQSGIALAALGTVAIIGSFFFLKLPDDGKWFPMFLVAGIAALWYGVQKYRWEH
jgi:hypothetical protein